MKNDATVDLIDAIARGKAEPADVAAALREQGISSVEDLLAAMRGMRARLDPGQGQVPLRLFGERRPMSANGPRRPLRPKLPVLLDGIVYDPEDFASAQARPVHLIWAGRDELIALQDETLVQTWWRLDWLNSLGRALEQYRDDPSVSAPYQPGTGLQSSSLPPMQVGRPAPGQTSPGHSSSTGDGPRVDQSKVVFYEDSNLVGDRLELARNRGYYDLTRVSRGIFSDWNDAISSLVMPAGVCVLHEHVHWSGQTLTLKVSIPNGGQAKHTLDSGPFLDRMDWNDRASSVEFW
jgi:hypothetical protein